LREIFEIYLKKLGNRKKGGKKEEKNLVEKKPWKIEALVDWSNSFHSLSLCER